MIYDFVFVVLVYRNTKDLEDFFCSLSVSNSKVIVVNSFYDDQTEHEFKSIALKNNAVFISVPNKGYGFGNNTGCRYALDNFKFEYLVISNADIEIGILDIKMLNKDRITASNIINRRGKHQNPAKPYYTPIVEWLMYSSYANRQNWGVWICCAYNKILRSIFYLSNFIFGARRIYEAHGSFLIIPSHILERLNPLFNEEMFLFAEEDHLARLARSNGFAMEYNRNILVHHKEDGSMGFLNEKQMDITRKSYLTYYEYWKKNKNR